VRRILLHLRWSASSALMSKACASGEGGRRESCAEVAAECTIPVGCLRRRPN
jgi:hypothetical protein